MTQRYFTSDHEWIEVVDGIATVGITNFAQEQLGDIVFVELPEAGRELARGDTAVVVESVKAASDVYAPVSGVVTEVNGALADEPGKINEAAEGDGWLWKMRVSDEGELGTLLDADAYQAQIA